jgi:hypothetical protein
LANPQASQIIVSGDLEDAENSDFRIVNVPPQSRHTLDLALEETFPASDPVSITISQVVRIAKGPHQVARTLR